MEKFNKKKKKEQEYEEKDENLSFLVKGLSLILSQI